MARVEYNPPPVPWLSPTCFGNGPLGGSWTCDMCRVRESCAATHAGDTRLGDTRPDNERPGRIVISPDTLLLNPELMPSPPDTANDAREKLIQERHAAMLAKDLAECDRRAKGASDGSTADYYVLPEGAAQLQELISFRNMNGQDAEMFRALYRKGHCSHSSKLREAKKVLFYAQAEVARIEKYGEGA